MMTMEECLSSYKERGLCLFWGQHKEDGREVFSQWHSSPFYCDGFLFKTAEHYMMHSKAILFNDFDSAIAILNASTPKRAKEIGRVVRNYNQDVWNLHKRNIVYSGNVLKFSQNDTLKQILLSTGNTILVEASPYDKIWGIGLEASNPDAMNPNLWQGENLLGFVLTDVRSNLKSWPKQLSNMMKEKL